MRDVRVFQVGLQAAVVAGNSRPPLASGCGRVSAPRASSISRTRVGEAAVVVWAPSRAARLEQALRSAVRALARVLGHRALKQLRGACLEAGARFSAPRPSLAPVHNMSAQRTAYGRRWPLR
jgi:plasmid stabilization system protein ParE